jgi:hypothetical protein
MLVFSSENHALRTGQGQDQILWPKVQGNGNQHVEKAFVAPGAAQKIHTPPSHPLESQGILCPGDL